MGDIAIERKMMGTQTSKGIVLYDYTPGGFTFALSDNYKLIIPPDSTVSGLNINIPVLNSIYIQTGFIKVWVQRIQDIDVLVKAIRKDYDLQPPMVVLTPELFNDIDSALRSVK